MYFNLQAGQWLGNSLIYNAIIKYGLKPFSLTIIVDMVAMVAMLGAVQVASPRDPMDPPKPGVAKEPSGLNPPGLQPEPPAL